MLTSIGKISKSFFIKLLVGIIILPFVFWGMGDVFRGGNQNIVASIDSNKISTQEFSNYLNRLNLSEEERNGLNKSNLIERILSDYIGKKVISLEIEDFGIKLTDSSLKEIIVNDKIFFKENKFSRTAYEKFLIKSGITAPSFEQNIVKQEKRRQLLSYLSTGLNVPDFLVQAAYSKENQIKTIKYIDLKKFYLEKKPQEKEIKEVYEKNKKIMVEEFKNIDFVQLKPNILIGTNEYNESFFKIIDKIENNILDGQRITDIKTIYNMPVTDIVEVNKKKIDKNGIVIENIENELFKKIFSIQEINIPQIIIFKNKYYLAEITSTIKKERSIKDKEVLKIIKAQINLKDKIINNTDIAKKINDGKFGEKEMVLFAKKNNLEVKNIKIMSLKDNKLFEESLIKKIFNTKDGDLIVITNSKLSKNYIVLAVESEFKKIKKNSSAYPTFLAKAKLGLSNEIFAVYDKGINSKYKITINNKTVNRIKNSF